MSAHTQASPAHLQPFASTSKAGASQAPACPISHVGNTVLPEHDEDDLAFLSPDELAALTKAAAVEPGSWRAWYREHQHSVEYFVAGGCAGAASRTVVSPLERLKILMQVQSSNGPGAYQGVLPGLAKMWQEEGFAGYMKGNGVNCLRIFPYSAVQFTTFESLKRLFTDLDLGGNPDVKGKGKHQPLGTGFKLVAGSLAGIASVMSTYPLDLVRSRLSISAAQLNGAPESAKRSTGKPLGIWGMTVKVYTNEGGMRGLYRGSIATAAGVAPYVGLNFVFYEKLRHYFLRPSSQGGLLDPGEGQIALIKLGCGAVAGGVSQTITYPFDVIRRKMQVVGLQRAAAAASSNSASLMPQPVAKAVIPVGARAASTTPTPATAATAPKTHAYTYTSGSGALKQIFMREGLRGLYRGIWPNLLKVAPQMGVSFYTYETVLDFLQDHEI